MPRAYRLSDSLTTSHYLLRRVTTADAAAIFTSYAADADVTRFLGWTPHRHVAETERFLAGAAREWEDGSGFPLIVSPRGAPAEVIGMFHPRLRGSSVSYGYVIARRAWGRGCASEILSCLVQHALAHPAIFRTEAFCDERNVASARVMERAGMQREGRLRRYFLHPNLSPEPTDCLLYARVR
ncbi:GNAT family N-acetyltransferase [Paracoccus tibetensis]|uniref:Protein N-acetyltransferase, RimJ/RimL family n=1 Tax=Paracoccus tibetensis TaxID=336292 RepID=A0A1G5DGA7_9RHOB|nr:GNAT family protein [Paracoccus tibetensis]SCY13782.1 Protein N-acetyltransferase, RimJ/RimL family [Paracoccus tibetensis]